MRLNLGYKSPLSGIQGMHKGELYIKFLQGKTVAWFVRKEHTILYYDHIYDNLNKYIKIPVQFWTANFTIDAVWSKNWYVYRESKPQSQPIYIVWYYMNASVFHFIAGVLQITDTPHWQWDQMATIENSIFHYFFLNETICVLADICH